MHLRHANVIILSILYLLVQMIEYIGELVRPPISDIRERRIYNSLVVSFSLEFTSALGCLELLVGQYEQHNFTVSNKVACMMILWLHSQGIVSPHVQVIRFKQNPLLLWLNSVFSLRCLGDT